MALGSLLLNIVLLSHSHTDQCRRTHMAKHLDVTAVVVVVAQYSATHTSLAFARIDQIRVTICYPTQAILQTREILKAASIRRDSLLAPVGLTVCSARQSSRPSGENLYRDNNIGLDTYSRALHGKPTLQAASRYRGAKFLRILSAAIPYR